jgi:hypothetical protein
MSATGSLWDAALGQPYSIVPDALVEKCKEAVWKWITRLFRNRTTGIRIAVKYLATLTGFSQRQVTRVLNLLEEKSVIRRNWAPMDRGVGGLTCQTIDILVRVIPPTDRIRKPRSAKENGPKKFAPTSDMSVTSLVTLPSSDSSYEESKKENSKSAAVGEPDGTGPPSAGGEPQTAAEAMAAIMAGAARVARPEPAPSAAAPGPVGVSGLFSKPLLAWTMEELEIKAAEPGAGGKAFRNELELRRAAAAEGQARDLAMGAPPRGEPPGVTGG